MYQRLKLSKEAAERMKGLTLKVSDAGVIVAVYLLLALFGLVPIPIHLVGYGR